MKKIFAVIISIVYFGAYGMPAYAASFMGQGTSAVKTNDMIITAKGAGDFQLGKPAPKDGYEVTSETEYSDEGEEYEIFVFSKNGEKNAVVDNLTNINYISIFSPLYKTETSVRLGIGSTLADLIKTFPDYELWYTYISGRFIFNSKKEVNVQFILENEGFIGKDELDISDMVTLTPASFKPNTSVTEVYIYSLN
jgi:hypothetical protein